MSNSPADLPLFTGNVSVDNTGAARPRTRVPQARRLAGHGFGRGDSTESPALAAVADVDPVPVPAGTWASVAAETDVRQVRAAVAEALVGSQEGRPLTAEHDGDRARKLIHDEVVAHNARRLQAGEQPMTGEEQHTLQQSVYDALFGLGRLEPLLAQDGLKSLEVRRGGRTWMVFGDGRIVEGPRLADTPETIIEEISRLARSSAMERPFDRSHPNIDLALPDGSRLNAQAYFTPYPTLTIRRHGYVDIDLDQYVTMGGASRSLAAFLTAAVRAQKTIVVAGVPGAGKTTLLRALLNVLPPEIPIGTIETEDELQLHKLEDRHPRVWAGQELKGGGEIVNGRPAGSLSVDDMIPIVLRAGVQIIVVGEVRGHEIIAMLEAMTAGHTSMTTVHAKNGHDAVERLVTCATKYGQVSTTWAYREVAQLVDLIVHVDLVDETPLGGRQHHYISEVVMPTLSAEAPVSVPPIYTPGPDGRAIPAPGAKATIAPWLDELRRHGFDDTHLNPGRGGWDTPLDLKLPRRTA